MAINGSQAFGSIDSYILILVTYKQ